jgi:SAM-dependent methyltransferase
MSGGGPDARRQREFYEREYRGTEYARGGKLEDHPLAPALAAFVRRYRLEGKRCLEIGAGRGVLQGMVGGYVGIDLARAAAKGFEKPFVQGTAEALPFRDGSFDAVWTYAVLEHVSRPERALAEMRRVLKPGGALLLHAAWYCRPWAADGYPVRPYSDFGVRGKLVKASISWRENVLFRSALVFPRRALREVEHRILGGRTSLRFRRLEPNLEKFWMSDSDAVACIDPHEVLLWFESRGDECVGFSGALRRSTARTGSFVIVRR